MRSWERRKGESGKAFAALQEYFSLGLQRSVAELARKLGKNQSLLHRWSRIHEWPGRAREYDEYRQKVEEDSWTEAALKQAEIWRERDQQIREAKWQASEQLVEQARTM